VSLLSVLRHVTLSRELVGVLSPAAVVSVGVLEAVGWAAVAAFRYFLSSF